MKLHLGLVLIQDNANLIQDIHGEDWNFLQGQIVATEHLLSVATDIMNDSNERYMNETIIRSKGRPSGPSRPNYLF
jgi:hypothetical protein